MLRTTITQTTRTIARATVAVGPAERTFVTTTVTQKSATETVKETADKLNKSVGSGLASAIETGESVTEAAKQAIGVGVDKTKQQANITGAKVSEAASTAQKKGAEAGASISQNARQAGATAKQKADEAAENVNNRT